MITKENAMAMQGNSRINTQPTKSTFTTRRLVMTGMLGAISILLGATRLGAIPVPNLSGDATIMHVPVIIGAVLEGPIVGVLVGAIFGIFSFLQTSPVPFFKDPLVSIVPRLFIGVTAYYAYYLFRSNPYVGMTIAAIVGTLTNTVLVVGAILWRFGADAVGGSAGAFILSLVPQVIAEVIIAVVITIAVVAAYRRIDSGSSRGSSV
jgi:uncharacterized membrane protein